MLHISFMLINLHRFKNYEYRGVYCRDTGTAGQPVQQCSAVQVCGVGPRVQCNVSGGRIVNISQPAVTVGLQRKPSHTLFYKVKYCNLEKQ